MSSLYLSRATLRSDAATNSLAELLDPTDSESRLDAHHKLLWSLFSDGEERKRDFLWRTEGRGHFMLLSRREPVNKHSLFNLETREFEPVLATNDRLAFSLRANAVVSRWHDSPKGKKRSRHDIVMDAMHKAEDASSNNVSGRPDLRDEQTQQASKKWLSAQGERCGFEVEHVLAQAYRVQRIPRGNLPDARFGILDMEGIIVVKNNELLLTSLALGFGKAKAFGNGLMLIKRASYHRV